MAQSKDEHERSTEQSWPFEKIKLSARLTEGGGMGREMQEG